MEKYLRPSSTSSTKTNETIYDIIGFYSIEWVLYLSFYKIKNSLIKYVVININYLKPTLT